MTVHRDTAYTGPTLVLRVLTTLLAAAVAVALISIPVAAIIFASKFISQSDATPPAQVPTTSRPASFNAPLEQAPAITAATRPATAKKDKKDKK